MEVLWQNAPKICRTFSQINVNYVGNQACSKRNGGGRIVHLYTKGERVESAFVTWYKGKEEKG